MKTAREWFEQQPEPMRTVLLNTQDIAGRNPDSKCPTLADAIGWGLRLESSQADSFRALVMGVYRHCSLIACQTTAEKAGAEIYQVAQQPRPKGSVLWYEQTKEGNPQWVWKVKGKEVQPLPLPDELPTQVAYISVSPKEYQRLKDENEQMRKESSMNRAMSECLFAAGIANLEQLYDVIDRATAFSELNQAMKEWMQEWEGRKNA